MKIMTLNECALLIRWQQPVSIDQHRTILSMEQLIRRELKGIVDIMVGYNSLMIHLDPFVLDVKAASNRLQALKDNLDGLASTKLSDAKLVGIPVLYNDEAGWDLPALVDELNLSAQDIVRLHTQTDFHAFATGFTLGFSYLGLLPKSLRTKRRSSPRVQVPKGAVAIAHDQSAVYPSASPGGWHIIGQTPISLIEIVDGLPTPLIKVGDSVRFTAIDPREFAELGGTVELEYGS